MEFHALSKSLILCPKDMAVIRNPLNDLYLSEFHFLL